MSDAVVGPVRPPCKSETITVCAWCRPLIRVLVPFEMKPGDVLAVTRVNGRISAWKNGDELTISDGICAEHAAQFHQPELVGPVRPPCQSEKTEEELCQPNRQP